MELIIRLILALRPNWPYAAKVALRLTRPELALRVCPTRLLLLLVAAPEEVPARVRCSLAAPRQPGSRREFTKEGLVKGGFAIYVLLLLVLLNPALLNPPW